MLARVPGVSAVFVGRGPEVEKIERALARLPMAFIYGVPGIGKSALTYEFARRWTGAKVYSRVTDGVTLLDMIDDIRRELAGGSAPELQCDDERIADLVERMDEREALWVVDDLHRLSEEARWRLLHAIGQNLTRGRLLGTSRTLVTVAADAPDRLELRLTGLPLEEARQLWLALDDMYGPNSAFDEAFARAHGSPLLLRRAHVGSLDDSDPFDTAVRELAPAELRTAAMLALSEMPLPLSVLDALLRPECARALLRKLAVDMIVDRPRSDAFVVHDLFRDSIVRALPKQAIAELRGALAAQLILDDAIDVVMATREACRQLVALGRFDDAGRLLIERGPQLMRRGAATDLLRMHESIPPAARSIELQTARARTMIRVFDLRGAFDELRRLVRATSAPSQELDLALGQVANLTGDVDVAEAELLHVLGDPSLTVARRVRALSSLAVTRVHQGRGVEAREFLEKVIEAVDDPLSACHALLVREFIVWVDEHEIADDRYYQRTQALLRHAPMSYRARIIGPLLWIGTLARQGRFAEAADHLRVTEQSLTKEDLLMRAQLRGVYAGFLIDRGDRVEALSELRSLSRALDHAGYYAGRLWADAMIARLQYIVGQRQAARRLVDDTVQRAESVGILGAARLARLACEWDPVHAVQHLEERAPHEEKRGQLARWHALSALRSAADGDAERLRAHQSALARLAVGPGYSVDRAVGHLADATLARLEGRAADNVTALEKAERECASEAADQSLLHALADAVGHVRVVTPTVRRIVIEPEQDLSGWDVVLDGREHVLRLGDEVIDLKTRPVLRRLLYLLAGHPGRVFNKEDLTAQIWGGTYNPLVHDNALKVNIARLRKLLAPTPLIVDFEESGYSLGVPERFLFIAIDSV